jgi:lysophospholipase L1-like esterase
MSAASKCMVAVAIACSLVGPFSTVAAVDRPAATIGLDRATRTSPASPALDPALSRIVVVGDSILFNRLGPGSRSNQVVPLAADALRSRYPGMSVRNLAVPGLSTLYPIQRFGTTLRPYLLDLLHAAGPRPHVVVIAVSSIDISVLAEVAVADIAPAVVSELRGIEQLLRTNGIVPVFAPAFGINGGIYNDLRSLSAPFRDYRFGERVATFNGFLTDSGLPLLFGRFEHLDEDGDSNADRRYFLANDPADRWPDDGIHPNALGEKVFGDNLANGLVAAFERG